MRSRLRALALAAKSGNEDIVALLLKRGADVDAVNSRDGNSALMLAANRGEVGVVQMLLVAKARVDIRAKDGWTALKAAEMIGDDEIVKILKAAGAKE